jgi:hypothetical protein
MLLGLSLVCMGLTLACAPPLWELFRRLTGGNFRVSPRFLAIAGFGMAILAAGGANLVLGMLRRAKLPFTVAVVALQIVCALWWIHRASLAADQTSNDAVHSQSMQPVTRAADERRLLHRLRSFGDLVTFQRGQREILAGHGYADGFLVVGNDFDPRRWRGPNPQPTFEGLPPGDVTFEHTRIELRHLPPSSTVRLRAIEPRFGLSILTSPRDARVEVAPTPSGLTVTNRGATAVDRVELVARLPISAVWFWLSILSVVVAAAWLLRSSRRRLQTRAAA